MAAGLSIVFAETAVAGPFDRAPGAYGTLVNHSIQQAGSDLRFQLDACRTLRRTECRFSASRIAVVVKGWANPPRTEKVTIATDLLREDATGDPQAAVIDALVTFGATMVILDPKLQAQQSAALISELTAEAFSIGRGERDGIDAHYSIAFDETADGLFVITVQPKR